MAIKNIIASAFAVAAFGSIAMAQNGQPVQPPKDGGMPRPGMERMGRGERGGMMGGRMRGGMNFEKLNLTDAQKQRIQAIQTAAKTSREANKAQFEEMGNLMRLKREGLLTSEQGIRLTALQAQSQTQMKANADKVQSDILAVLTADQRTLIDQMKNERGNGRRMRGGMPGMPMPSGRPNGAAAPPSEM
jgi:Spy/CpxP family protein refolding chaperone